MPVQVAGGVFNALLSPDSDGRFPDIPVINRAHERGALVAVAADLLSLTLRHRPAIGADAVSARRRGSAYRSGSGPARHTSLREFRAPDAERDNQVSIDSHGNPLTEWPSTMSST
jgi:glycine dehydrogenase